MSRVNVILTLNRVLNRICGELMLENPMFAKNPASDLGHHYVTNQLKCDNRGTVTPLRRRHVQRCLRIKKYKHFRIAGEGHQFVTFLTLISDIHRANASLMTTEQKGWDDALSKLTESPRQRETRFMSRCLSFGLRRKLPRLFTNSLR
jgi:hypothetical protein